MFPPYRSSNTKFFWLRALITCCSCRSQSTKRHNANLRSFSSPWEKEEYECKKVAGLKDVDIDTYIDGRWYIHQQAVTEYLPLEQNYCVFAEYTKSNDFSIWGYDIKVKNYSQTEDGVAIGSGNEWYNSLCAFVKDESVPGELAVAPCFLPKWLSGPYWIVAYDEKKGYALISGGQPTVPTGNGKCTTGDGTNDSGLWIFARSPDRDDDLINEVRAMADDMGFDLSILNDVNHVGCDYDVQPGTTQVQQAVV